MARRIKSNIIKKITQSIESQTRRERTIEEPDEVNPDLNIKNNDYTENLSTS